MKQLSIMLPKASKKLLAEGLLVSKILYLISLWGGSAEKHLTAAQRLMNKIARWVTGSSRKTKISILMEEIDWFTIKEHTSIHSLTQLWKIVHMNKPSTTRELIVIEEDFHLTTKTPRLQLTEHSFTWRATRTWNLLPPDTRSLQSLPVFKSRVNKWIKEGRRPTPD